MLGCTPHFTDSPASWLSVRFCPKEALEGDWEAGEEKMDLIPGRASPTGVNGKLYFPSPSGTTRAHSLRSLEGLEPTIHPLCLLEGAGPAAHASSSTEPGAPGHQSNLHGAVSTHQSLPPPQWSECIQGLCTSHVISQEPSTSLSRPPSKVLNSGNHPLPLSLFAVVVINPWITSASSF